MWIQSVSSSRCLSSCSDRRVINSEKEKKSERTKGQKKDPSHRDLKLSVISDFGSRRAMLFAMIYLLMHAMLIMEWAMHSFFAFQLSLISSDLKHAVA